MEKNKRIFIHKTDFEEPSVSDIIKRNVNQALLNLVFKQNSIGLIASAIIATIFFYGLYYTQDRSILYAWYLCTLFIIICRGILDRVYLKLVAPEKHFILWRSLFIIGTSLNGICWGIVGSVLLQNDTTFQIIFTIMLLAGLTAGSVPILSGLLSASIPYLIFAILPFSITLQFIEGGAYQLFAIASYFYLIFLILLSVKTHNILVGSIRLQFENNALLQNLSTAKSELEDTNKRLEHTAMHDSLTDLANRGNFAKTFTNLIKRAERDKTALALIYIDLDNFKEVNDAFGHHVGDALLQKIVERLKHKLPPNVLASRLGGDELTVILEDVRNIDEIAQFAQQICDTLARPYGIHDYKIIISVSLGISIYPLDGVDSDMLIKNADKAMYYVKDRGGNNYHFNTDVATIKTFLSNLSPRSTYNL